MLQTTRTLNANAPQLEKIEKRQNAILLDNAYEAFLSRHSRVNGLVRQLVSHHILGRLDPDRMERSKRVQIMFERIELDILRKDHQSIDLFVWLWNRGAYPPDYIAKRYGLDTRAEFEPMLEKYTATVQIPVVSGDSSGSISYAAGMVQVQEERRRIRDDQHARDTFDAIIGTLLERSPVLKPQSPPENGAAPVTA